MSSVPHRHSISLTNNASALIPNYDMLQIPRIDGLKEFSKLSFLIGPKYKMFCSSLPFPDKRILNIPCQRRNSWNNYIVHSMNSDYLESWRDDCKIPDNWIGPKLKEVS